MDALNTAARSSHSLIVGSFSLTLALVPRPFLKRHLDRLHNICTSWTQQQKMRRDGAAATAFAQVYVYTYNIYMCINSTCIYRYIRRVLLRKEWTEAHQCVRWEATVEFQECKHRYGFNRRANFRTAIDHVGGSQKSVL